MDRLDRNAGTLDPFVPGQFSMMRVTRLRWIPVVLSLAACGDLLDVNDPDITRPEQLTEVAGLDARRMGAFGDFTVAYSGTAGQVLYSGTFADELIKVGPFTERAALDARRADPTNAFLPDFYSNLHRARRAAESAADAWEVAEDIQGTSTTLAEMNALAGFTYVFFGENFCSGVPFSHVTEAGDVVYADVSSTEEALQTAIDRFATALGHAEQAGDSDVQFLARIGHARALLNLGQFQQAADAVASVPTDWEWAVLHSVATARQANGLVQMVNVTNRWAVANRKGGGLDFREAYEAGDPRTPWVEAGPALVPQFTAYHQLKYPERDSPIVMASGIEARLVEAEAALRNGDATAFQEIHNALRNRLATETVGPIDVDTLDAEQRVDFHFRERALWLWLSGHRHGDMRRLIRQYDRAVNDVFPTGTYHNEAIGTFGERVVYPIPNVERNNPLVADRQNICIHENA